MGWWVEGDDGPFAQPGDSGSIVVDEEHRVVGMAVAINVPRNGEPHRTFCHSAAAIFASLGIALL